MSNEGGLDMDFKEAQAIYMQIADVVCEHILTGKWTATDRIPSVRELGMQLQVNPNTVMRAYELLQSREIIYNKRGIGFFVAEDAREKVLDMQRTNFINNELPAVYRNMLLLGIPVEQMVRGYEAYKQKKEGKE